MSGRVMPGLVFHPNYDIPLPDGHRFPATKFSRLMSCLRDRGLLGQFELHQPAPALVDDLARIHDPAYITAIADGTLSAEQIRVLGLGWSDVLARRSFLAVNGTLFAARLALDTGLACHGAGGTHHAHYGHGAGFCVFNDLAYAATRLVDEGRVQSVLILDCDVHQGDGTARILARDDRVKTCSIHCRTNYPARKAISDFDVEVEKGTGDEEYLAIVAQSLDRIGTMWRRPDLVIYDAGVDVHENDKLGYLNISDAGLFAREMMIIQHFRSQNIPVATVIGGGYGSDQDEVAQRHSVVFEAALTVANG